VYNKYTTIKHRRDLLKGFHENMSEDGYLQARIGGFTNTLRVKHREIVNLPGVDKPYGSNVRGCLIAGEGEISLGSDLSSLEDNVKLAFLIPHDPDYVATMSAADYDSHLNMAVVAGFITHEEMEAHKAGNETPETKAARKLGKTCNYAAVYNSGAATLARGGGFDLKTAERLLEGYWRLNWGVKAIAEEQYVIKDALSNIWLVNPINGFCYPLRKEADRFSVLAQGTGSFIFDVWIDECLRLQKESFGKGILTFSAHDEQVVVFKDNLHNRARMTEITNEALDIVNKKYKLRRVVGCDIQFGRSYAEIH